MYSVLPLVISMFFSSGSFAFQLPLTTVERDRLRFHLENYFNQLDLIIRNQRSDESLARRQKKDMKVLGVYTSIPLSRDLNGLKTSLRESAREFGVNSVKVYFKKRFSSAPRVPAKLNLDQPAYRLSADVLAEEISFTILAKGRPQAITDWIESWPSRIKRIVHPVGRLQREKKSASAWYRISARAYCFRPIEYPRFVLRDPLVLVSTKTDRASQLLATSEPLLWSFVERSRKLIPIAAPLFDKRREYLLDRARMEFYMSKTLVATKKNEF